MIDEKHTYEAPEVQVFVVKMDSGILQSSVDPESSLDANRNDYGDSIPVEW